jgi:hypothetical protein
VSVSNFGTSGFGNHGNKLLDTVTAEIVIRKSPKEKEEGSALTGFGFRRSERQARDQWIHESAKSDFPKQKGEFLKLTVGTDFPKGK